MRSVIGNFLRGLAVVLPLVLTVWLLVWVVTSIEGLLRPIIVAVLPDRLYLPGLGIALGLIIIYACGVLMQVFLIKRLWAGIESLLNRVPLVKSIYSSISDLVGFFSNDKLQQASRVVSVDMGDNTRLIGFITDESPQRVSAGGSDQIAVYFPMSYQVGGYTLLLPKSRVDPLDIPVEEAMRFILTAGIRGHSN